MSMDKNQQLITTQFTISFREAELAAEQKTLDDLIESRLKNAEIDLKNCMANAWPQLFEGKG